VVYFQTPTGSGLMVNSGSDEDLSTFYQATFATMNMEGGWMKPNDFNGNIISIGEDNIIPSRQS